MIADSHTHILDPRLIDKADEIIKNLQNDGIDFIVEISADPDEAWDALDFASKHERVFCTVGVHPVMAASYNAEFENWVLGQVGNKKIVAVGECGLDYYHKDCPPEIQREIFIRQIELAHKMKLPLVIHTRDAFEDTFEILCSHRDLIKNGLLIHCFSYGSVEVNRIREVFDAYFAFGGAITYKNNIIAAAAIKAVPLNRILVETDCPYLTPVPFRSQLNEPKNVKLVAAHIAKINNLTVDETEKFTLENTKRFYNIK